MKRWQVIGLVVLGLEAVALGTYWETARPAARTVYVWLWEIAPKPANLEHAPPPDRFLAPYERLDRTIPRSERRSL